MCGMKERDFTLSILSTIYMQSLVSSLTKRQRMLDSFNGVVACGFASISFPPHIVQYFSATFPEFLQFQILIFILQDQKKKKSILYFHYTYKLAIVKAEKFNLSFEKTNLVF